MTGNNGQTSVHKLQEGRVCATPKVYTNFRVLLKTERRCGECAVAVKSVFCYLMPAVVEADLKRAGEAQFCHNGSSFTLSPARLKETALHQQC